MNIPNISDLLNKKIAEIQGRLPLKINTPSNIGVSFDAYLSQASKTTAPTAPVIDAELLTAKTDLVKPSGTKYPLVSGSYESVYPRLSQADIQDIMPRIDAAINTYSKQFGLDPKLVRAVIKQESGFQPFALSTSGAQGLMQLMPNTADGLGVTDPYNIEQNIKGGTQYLYYQLNTFGGDLKLSLAAYNAGPNAVKKYAGVPPYEQTQDYIKKVMGYYDMYQAMGDN